VAKTLKISRSSVSQARHQIRYGSEASDVHFTHDQVQVRFDYEIHYEYYVEDEDRAWACLGILELMRKFKVVVTKVDWHQNHAGDITLTVGYSYQGKS